MRLPSCRIRMVRRPAPTPNTNSSKPRMDQGSLSGAEPGSLCLLRTSAIGDVTHVVPLVRTVQHRWPQTRLTWLIGKLEHKLVGDVPGVEFIVFDKHAGRAGYRDVREKL